MVTLGHVAKAIAYISPCNVKGFRELERLALHGPSLLKMDFRVSFLLRQRVDINMHTHLFVDYISF